MRLLVSGSPMALSLCAPRGQACSAPVEKGRHRSRRGDAGAASEGLMQKLCTVVHLTETVLSGSRGTCTPLSQRASFPFYATPQKNLV